jgi:hypothetical protein
MKSPAIRLLQGIGILALLCGSACTPASEYDRAVREGLASGQRYDSLFLDLRLGMTAKAFYDTCWRLNRQGLIKEGPSNASAEYALPELKHPGYMDFYPQFQDSIVTVMDLSFRYAAWAPWNRPLWADSLEADVIRIFERWYGPGFLRIESKKRGQHLYVKVDGNRQIKLYQQDNQFVRGQISDLSVAANRPGK